MSEDTIVLGAAIIRDSRLLVARRSQPPAMAGYWELPGTELDGDERGTLDGFFTHEFCAPLNCVDQLLSDRSRTGWHRGDVLRVWRCQLPGEVVDAPRPAATATTTSRGCPSTTSTPSDRGATRHASPRVRSPPTTSLTRCGRKRTEGCSLR